MKKIAAFAVFFVCFSFSYVAPAFSEWTTWWATPYWADYTHQQTDFPTTRPVWFRVFYQNSEIGQWFVDTDNFHDGIEGGDWELMIDGTNYYYYETDPDYYFNRIDIGFLPEPPDSITVPDNKPSGQYTVSWTASPTSGVTYTLEEATDSSFTSGLRTVVSDTTALSAQISNRTSGVTYYYRVQAVEGNGNDVIKSDWTQGGNGCMVSPWTPWWSSGPWQECLEQTGFPDTRPIAVRIFHKDKSSTLKQIYTLNYDDGQLVIDQDGTRLVYCEVEENKHFKRIDIAYQQEPPSSVSVPTSSTTGDYTVSWGASPASGVTYILEEAEDSTEDSNFSSVTLADPTALSAQITGKEIGKTYYYRVRTSRVDEYNDALLSDWVSGTNGCLVSDGWTTFWTGYSDFMSSYSFPTRRPISIRIYYQSGAIWEENIPGSSFYEGDDETWWLDVNGNWIEYYEAGEFFNRIDIK
jgi:hypothetical protein